MQLFSGARLLAAIALAGHIGLCAAQEIVLGQTASVNHAVVGTISTEYNAGIKLAVARANAAGGIRGRKLRLDLVDDNFDAKNTVGAVDELVTHHDIVALVGAMGTQPVLKLAEDKTLEKYQLASIGPMTGLQSALSKPNEFPVRGSYEDEVRAMLGHSARLGRGKVLYLYYEAGVGPLLAKLVPDMAKEAHATLTGLTGFEVTQDKSLQQAAVRKALEAAGPRPQSIILLAIGSVHSEAMKVVRERYGQSMPVYSLGQVNPATLVKDIGSEASWGLMLSQVMPRPGNISLAITREFEADRLRYSASQPSTYMFLEGYVTGRIAIELVGRAKTLTREGVLKAAEQAGQLDVGGFRVQYGADARRSVNPIELTMLGRTGKLVR